MGVNYSMLQSEVNHASAAGKLTYAVGFERAPKRMETMGKRIRMLRKSKDWTQEELAARLAEKGASVTGNAISQWERDEIANIKLSTFLALVEVLGTTHEYLVHGPSDPARDSTGKFRRPRPGSGNRA